MDQQQIEWQQQGFDELTTHELYQIMMLREAVFVVEQDCPYQDADGQDLHAIHLSGWQQQQLLAYARIFAPSPNGKKQGAIKIGRVVTDSTQRRLRLGSLLMQQAVNYCDQQWPDSAIVISAQSHLQGFYQRFGFVAFGEGYLEDGIPHHGMRRPASRA